MYPESNESALLDQLLTERAISDLVELALALWLPGAEKAVLHAAAPPPDPTAAVSDSGQWDYLVDALIVYGIAIIAADAYLTAYRALTGVQLAVGDAAVKLISVSMPGMPTREDLAKRAGAILSRHLSINVSSVEQVLDGSPPLRSFVSEHSANVRRRVMDAVGRTYRRVLRVTDTAAPEAAREEVVGVFDPLSPQWQDAADEVGQTHGSGTLNAALEQAARDTGRELEIGWVAILDTHTRLAHAQADGQRRAPGSAFDVGGEPLRFPGDPLGDLDNTVNCRCRLFAYFTSPALAAAAAFAEMMNGRPYIYRNGDEIDEFKNWVEECGGLPKYIKRITKHLQEKGMPQSQAIATAVGAAKKMCSTGDTNFPGKQEVNPGSRAEACSAVADWEKLKVCAAKKRAEKAAQISVIFDSRRAAAMSVTGTTSLPVGDRNASWDGPGAAGRVLDKFSDSDGKINVSQASRAFLWHDGDGTNRGDYKLGFADIVNGTLTVIPKGAAACAGGRGVGAASIPAADKSTIETKICTLYSKIRAKYTDWPPCPFSGSGSGSSHSIQAAAAGDYRSFTSVLAVIGVPTDDGRMFANDIQLSFRDMPLPMLWQRQSAGGHYDAFTVGVIESAGVVGKEVIGKGYMLNTPEAQEAAMQIEHGVTGPSVDLGDVEWELRDSSGQPITEGDYYANPDMEMIQTVMSAKILAATLVATPAFGQTSIVLGDTVARAEDALVATAALAQPGVIDVPVYAAEFFDDPEFAGPTLLHMTPEGRIMGHLAAFNVCHIGIQDSCVIAPRSATEYAWFHTAPPVKTESGPMKVGRLTVGGGHAGARLNVGATIAHYDNAGTCFALVHVGEDEHGIWFSGIPAPGATPEQVEQGLSAPLSGDWRNVGGNLELVAALAVNTPGFPIIASGATDETDSPLALVASLGPCAGDTVETPTGTDGLSTEQVRAFVKIVMDEQRDTERRASAARDLISGEIRRQAAAIIEGAF